MKSVSATRLDNVVLVGSRKAVARYVAAILYKFFVEKRDRIEVRALGNAISRAVHAATGACMLARELCIENVSIGTVRFVYEGRTRYVSRIVIEIVNRDRIA